MNLKTKSALWRCRKACALALNRQVDLNELHRELFAALQHVDEQLAYSTEYKMDRTEEEWSSLLNRRYSQRQINAALTDTDDREGVEHQISPLLIAWANKMKVQLDKKTYYWLMPDHMTGYFNGLPEKRGTAKFTNGIDLWIELPNGEPFKGHLDWFRKDGKRGGGKGRKSKKKEIAKVMEEARAGEITTDQIRERMMALLSDE